MKTKILIIIFALLIPLGLVLVSCGTKSKNYQDNSSERFVFVEKIQNNFEDKEYGDVDIYIAVDKETKIMYFVFWGFEKIAIETMLDKDGKPMIYKGDL